MFRMDGLAVAIFLVFLPFASVAEDCAESDFPVSLVWPENAAVPVAAIPLKHWFQSGSDWIVAPDGCAAAIVAEELLAARVAFERYFQKPQTSGVVIDLRYAAHAAALSAAGADWVLPWQFSASASSNESTSDPVRALIEDQIRTQVESQLSQNGQTPDPARVEALVAQALSQWEASRSDDPSDNASTQPETSTAMKRPDAIRHEVAHLLFIHELWPSTEGVDQYAGDAPDWLDETAAVLAESETMTADRRAAFVEAMKDGTLMALPEYLAMPHPAFAGGAFQDLIEQARAQSDGTGMVFISAENLPDVDLDDAAMYYTVTRGWIDFLTETSHNPRVFADLTQTLKANGSLEDWLTMHGPAYNLPDDFDQLQTNFMAWAEARTKN